MSKPKPQQSLIPGVDPPTVRPGWAALSNSPEAIRQRRCRNRRRARLEAERDSAEKRDRADAGYLESMGRD